MRLANKRQLLMAGFTLAVSGFSGCVAIAPTPNFAGTADHERTLLIADTYASQGHHERAEALYASVLKAQPGSEAAASGLARIAAATGRPAAGQTVAKTAAAAPAATEAALADATAGDVVAADVVAKTVVAGKAVPAAVVPADADSLAASEPVTPVVASVTAAPVAIAVMDELDAPQPPAEDASPEPAPSDTPAPSTDDSVALSSLSRHAKRTSTATGEAVSREGWDNEFFVAAAGPEAGLDYDLHNAVAEAGFGGWKAADGWRSSGRSEAAPAVAQVDLSGNAPAAVDVTESVALDTLGTPAERLREAARRLSVDASDRAAWDVLDLNLRCEDPARQSLAVLTLGELPAACHAPAAGRLQRTLALEPNDEVRTSAALVLGGLGTIAEPAVPMLREIVQTAAARPAEAARVSLLCLGYEN